MNKQKNNHNFQVQKMDPTNDLFGNFPTKPNQHLTKKSQKTPFSLLLFLNIIKLCIFMYNIKKLNFKNNIQTKIL